MSAQPDLPDKSRWALSRLVILILAFGFLGLVVDLRVEHMDVVKERIVGWTPIVYSTLMSIACLAGVFIWNRIARRILIALFALAFGVGGLGVYLHNGGNLARPFELGLQAWTDPQMKHLKGPPPDAPMAFAGLGLLGIIASLERFGSTPAKKP